MVIIYNNDANALIRKYNLQNVPVQADSANPYIGKISPSNSKDAPLYRSSLGTPVITDITFKGGTYVDYNNRSVNFDDVTLVTVLLQVSQPNKIIKTEIQGRDGTVKEYIGKDDYSVTVNGIITGTNGAYPYSEVRALKNMLNAPIAIEVVSRYLQNLDIYNLVVEDWAFEQDAGGYSYQGFTINCISDDPVEFKII